jgi:ribosome-binding factor A
LQYCKLSCCINASCDSWVYEYACVLQVLQGAVCPEKKNGGGDNALSAIATVTEVELTNDLQVAKVFVSVFSDEFGRQQAMAGLKSLEG